MPLLTESFNTADSDTLGPDQTWTELGAATWSVSTNRASISAATGSPYNMARLEATVGGTDHYAQALVFVGQSGVSGSYQQRGGVAVRFDAAANTHYAGMVQTRNGGGTDIRAVIARVEAGTVTDLASATITSAENVVVKLEVEGTALRLYVDGMLTVSTTDATLTSGTRVGMIGARRTSSVSWYVDTFEANVLVSAARTGTVAQSAPSATQDAAATYLPSRSATSAQSAPPPTQDAAATHLAPVFALSSAQVSLAPTSSAAATRALPLTFQAVTATGWTATGGTAVGVLSDTDDATYLTSPTDPAGAIVDLTMRPIETPAGDLVVRLRGRHVAASSGSLAVTLRDGGTTVATATVGSLTGTVADIAATFATADIAGVIEDTWQAGTLVVRVEATAV